jgi:hypothetical protein
VEAVLPVLAKYDYDPPKCADDGYSEFYARLIEPLRPIFGTYTLADARQITRVLWDAYEVGPEGTEGSEQRRRHDALFFVANTLDDFSIFARSGSLEDAQARLKTITNFLAESSTGDGWTRRALSLVADDLERLATGAMAQSERFADWQPNLDEIKSGGEDSL